MLLIKSLGRLASTRIQVAYTASTTPSVSSTFSSSATLLSSTLSNNSITIKDSCLKRLKQVLEKPQEEFLRIDVSEGGCSGFSYLFEIQGDHIDSSEDLVFERDSYRVVIKKDIFPFMKGASIEFNESLIKSSFEVLNPVADTKCSCGSSFFVDLAKINKKNKANQ